MSETLTQRKREMLKRCTDAAQQLGQPVLFGMTTSLILQSVPLPKDCDINPAELHTVSDSHRTRIRAIVPPTTPHIWKPLSDAHKVRINKHVYTLDLIHTWAQLATHISLESLVILGDAILTAIARKPGLANGRTADGIYQDFVRQVTELPKFNAKSKCMIALAFITPRVDSPMESKTRIATTKYGLPPAVTNYTVPGATFSNGAPITLDLGPNFASPSNMTAIIIAPTKTSGGGTTTSANCCDIIIGSSSSPLPRTWPMSHPKPNSPTGSGGSWHCEVPYSISL